MSLQLAAQHLASRGRGPDTTLVHMAPHEVAGLQALARAQGGSLTINPDTGLAEAGFLSDLFKAALPMAAGWALGPAGFGLMSSLGAGATVGGISALASGSLSKGITAGLGAYGGSELASGLSNFGDSSLTGLAAQAPSSAVGGMDPAQRAASAMAGNAPAADKLGSVFGGAKAAIANPSAFAGSMGGWGGVAKNVGMAAAPILAMPTATQMPTPGGSNTALIRTSKYDPKTGAYTQGEAVPASEWGSRDIGPYNYYGANRMADGGLTQNFAPGEFGHMAIDEYGRGYRDGYGTAPPTDGRLPWSRGPGYIPAAQAQTANTTTQMPGMTNDSSAAYKYLMGTGPNPFANVSYAPPAPKKEEDKAKDTTGADDAGDAGIGSLLPVIRDGGNDAGQPGGGWGAKDLSDKAAFWGENKGWANLHEKMLGLVPFDTQAKRDEQHAIDMSRSIGPSTTTPEEQATKNALADQMRAAEHGTGALGPTMDVSNAKEGWGKSGNADVDVGGDSDSSMGFGIEGGGYGGMSGDGNGGGGGGADGSGGGPGDSGGPRANGGAVGQYAQGGLSSLGSYSDGGRLLRGPGDGVSDSIPAHIGRNMQPAQLADGEFVVPARIVSELGNGSTEAGARQLYKMMERIQAGRAKTTGKNKVAVNSRAAKHLPA